MLIALVVIVLLFQVLTGGLLLTPNNVASLIRQNAYVLILSVGMLMVIVGRHIDLSVGSVVGFIGGAAVSGGVGRVSGTVAGALIMGVLNMGLSIMGVDSAWQPVIKGLVPLIAVAVDVAGKRRGRL